MPDTRPLPTLLMLLLSSPAIAQVDVFADPQNLEVLPQDISSRELGATMRRCAMGLGVRCETCHVGEAGQPLSTFDFASDEKTMKQKARLMLRMVDEINGKLVARLDDVDPEQRVEVRCVTCHRGRQQPKLIEDVLDEKLADEGADAAVAEYERLREKYYGSHSFDFSEMVLPMYSQGIAGGGRIDAAIVLTELNAGHYPDSYYTTFVLAELYAAAGRKDEAVVSFERAISLNPGAADFLKQRIKALKRE